MEAASGDKYARTQFDLEVLSLQYLKGVQETDNSGLCIAEIAGQGIVNAAETVVTVGMEIVTKSAAILEKQKEVLADILAHHDRDCKNCRRTGNCELQDVQYALRMTKNPAKEVFDAVPVREDSILIRDDNKCIRCGRCVAVCDRIQGIGAIKMEGEGMDAKVIPVNGTLEESGCVGCGQCITVCPVGALYERDDVAEVEAAIADPDKFVVIQAAPSVRVGLGEAFNIRWVPRPRESLRLRCGHLVLTVCLTPYFPRTLQLWKRQLSWWSVSKMAAQCRCLPPAARAGSILRKNTAEICWIISLPANRRSRCSVPWQRLIFLKKKAFRRIVSL